MKRRRSTIPRTPANMIRDLRKSYEHRHPIERLKRSVSYVRKWFDTQEEDEDVVERLLRRSVLSTCEETNKITTLRLSETLRLSLERILDLTLLSSSTTSLKEEDEEEEEEENVPELCRALTRLSRRASAKQREIQTCLERESKLKTELNLEREKCVHMKEKINMMSDLLAQAKIEGILPKGFDAKRLLDFTTSVKKKKRSTVTTQTAYKMTTTKHTQTKTLFSSNTSTQTLQQKNDGSTQTLKKVSCCGSTQTLKKVTCHGSTQTTLKKKKKKKKKSCCQSTQTVKLKGENVTTQTFCPRRRSSNHSTQTLTIAQNCSTQTFVTKTLERLTQTNVKSVLDSGTYTTSSLVEQILSSIIIIIIITPGTQINLPSKTLVIRKQEIQNLKAQGEKMNTKIKALTQELQTANMCLALRRKERTETQKEIENLKKRLTSTSSSSSAKGGPELDHDNDVCGSSSSSGLHNNNNNMKHLQRKVLILSSTVQTLQAELERIKMDGKKTKKNKKKKRKGC